MDKGEYWEDHLGNRYNTQLEMCAYYSIRPSLFINRLRMGWSIEKALTTKTPNRDITDHNGIRHESFSDMCIYYGKAMDVVKYRLSRGWSLQDALEVELERHKVSSAFACMDHEGRRFKSISEMCIYHKIPRSLYNYRIKTLKMTQQVAFETPIVSKQKRSS